MADLRGLFNNAPDLFAAIQKAINDNAELRKQVEDFKAQKAVEIRKRLTENAVEINGVKVISGMVPLGTQIAKDIAFQLRAQFPERLLIALGATTEGKPSLTVSFSDDLVKEGKHAGNIIREAAKLIQGGGGGQPHFATAGGKNPEGMKDAINKIIQLAEL